jgi:hypothetical protein
MPTPSSHRKARASVAAARYGRFSRLARKLGLPTPEAEQHTPTHRRTLDGRKVAKTTDGHNADRFWYAIVPPGPRPTGGAKADPNHPSRKHDGPARSFTWTPSGPEAGKAIPSRPRRRDRRPAMVGTAKNIRRAKQAQRRAGDQ